MYWKPLTNINLTSFSLFFSFTPAASLFCPYSFLFFSPSSFFISCSHIHPSLPLLFYSPAGSSFSHSSDISLPDKNLPACQESMLAGSYNNSLVSSFQRVKRYFVWNLNPKSVRWCERSLKFSLRFVSFVILWMNFVMGLWNLR